MSEEVVYNANQGPRSTMMYCNWCTESFEYRETGDVAHNNTTCPWCRHKLVIPRHKLRRINGHNGRVRQ